MEGKKISTKMNKKVLYYINELNKKTTVTQDVVKEMVSLYFNLIFLIKLLKKISGTKEAVIQGESFCGYQI